MNKRVFIIGDVIYKRADYFVALYGNVAGQISAPPEVDCYEIIDYDVDGNYVLLHTTDDTLSIVEGFDIRYDYKLAMPSEITKTPLYKLLNE